MEKGLEKANATHRIKYLTGVCTPSDVHPLFTPIVCTWGTDTQGQTSFVMNVIKLGNFKPNNTINKVIIPSFIEVSNLLFGAVDIWILFGKLNPGWIS